MTVKKLTATVALLAATLVLGACSNGAAAPLGEIGSAATTTAPPAPEPGYSFDEQVYIDTLAIGDIEYSTEDAAITAGNAVCDFLRTGGSSFDAADIVIDNTSYTAYEAGYIVGAAQGALCPELAGA